MFQGRKACLRVKACGGTRYTAMGQPLVTRGHSGGFRLIEEFRDLFVV
jgi:hypothetical protein